MLRYRDSGKNSADVSPGEWFDEHVVGGICAFRGQFGFFRFSALSGYAPILRKLALDGRTVNLVLGSNETDPLTIDDAEAVLEITADGTDSHLTVVALKGALFHPKVCHVIQEEESCASIVGSANLTRLAMERNVEAWVEIESGTDYSDQALQDIQEAIDWWQTSTDEGVYQLASVADARRLLADGLLVERAEQQHRHASTQRAVTATTGRGSRRRRWTPPQTAAEYVDERGEEVGIGEEAGGEPHAAKLRWCKKLSASDALQTGAGTNQTGKLRLGKARHDIDQNTWFREQLFGDQVWVGVLRGAKTYDEVHVSFAVRFPRKNFDKQTLLVDHAPHREANQSNVVTVLSWGPVLGKWLQKHSQTGKWVVIELDERGEYSLRIQGTKPTWAP